LYDIYEFALVNSHVTANAADLPKRPATVEVQSLALAPHHWTRGINAVRDQTVGAKAVKRCAYKKRKPKIDLDA
jgi:hypothetical protein